MEVSPMQIRMQNQDQKTNIDKYYHLIKSGRKGTKGNIILNALKYYYEEFILTAIEEKLCNSEVKREIGVTCKTVNAVYDKQLKDREVPKEDMELLKDLVELRLLCNTSMLKDDKDFFNRLDRIANFVIEEKLQISKDIKLIIGRDATSEDYKKLGEILKRNLEEEKLEREKR